MRLLLVEDDPRLGVQLRDGLAEAGYAVDLAVDGEDAQHLGATEPYDAVVLDLGLPGVDGVTMLRRWRAEGKTVPVLVLTARDGWSETVAGFDAGADDYVTKPFHMAELKARLRALIRRAGGHADPVLRCGPVSLDTRTGEVTLDGAPVSLTAYELRLLTYLMHNAGRTVSQTELAEHLYSFDCDRDSNTIQVLVARLRRKLPRDLIRTRRGLGYQLADPAEPLP